MPLLDTKLNLLAIKIVEIRWQSSVMNLIVNNLLYVVVYFV